VKKVNKNTSKTRNCPPFGKGKNVTKKGFFGYKSFRKRERKTRREKKKRNEGK